ncbi:hypothetical protein PAECIP111893_05332 [Paenibacillus plantiphilus]|uniref:NYN domain-containing protein n=2 Tax=Paenibacillus plantiphilus TaxID=2905650 RepID=A0ABM9CWD7_9BACL|nr:hypothetical protein PAECIP111893_05332 [Paenibacillus plantiphilus]
MDNYSLNLLKRQVLKETGDNVAIFIDYDNIYHGLKDYALDVHKDCNIIDLLWDIYGRNRVRTIKAYADFDQIDITLRDLQQNRVQIRQVYGNGRGEKNRKNASDIELSIDAVECYYKNSDIDTYVFVTADSDMIPIMSRTMFNGNKVHLYYMSTNVSQYQDITDYAHISQDFIKLFKINIERAKPHFWLNNAKDMITKWYADSRNRDKLYGPSWLNEGLRESFGMSYKLASGTIQYMEDTKLIEKIKHTVKGNTIEGYILTADKHKYSPVKAGAV